MTIPRLLAAALLTLAGTLHAQTGAMTDGEVRKIDKPQGKLTLKHGPIAHLDMPPMTMVFKVADPKLLDGLKAGDKLRFAVASVNGSLVVTALEPLR